MSTARQAIFSLRGASDDSTAVSDGAPSWAEHMSVPNGFEIPSTLQAAPRLPPLSDHAFGGAEEGARQHAPSWSGHRSAPNGFLIPSSTGGGADDDSDDEDVGENDGGDGGDEDQTDAMEQEEQGFLDARRSLAHRSLPPKATVATYATDVVLPRYPRRLIVALRYAQQQQQQQRQQHVATSALVREAPAQTLCHDLVQAIACNFLAPHKWATLGLVCRTWSSALLSDALLWRRAFEQRFGPGCCGTRADRPSCAVKEPSRQSANADRGRPHHRQQQQQQQPSLPQPHGESRSAREWRRALHRRSDLQHWLSVFVTDALGLVTPLLFSTSFVEFDKVLADGKWRMAHFDSADFSASAPPLAHTGAAVGGDASRDRGDVAAVADTAAAIATSATMGVGAGAVDVVPPAATEATAASTLAAGPSEAALAAHSDNAAGAVSAVGALDGGSASTQAACGAKDTWVCFEGKRVNTDYYLLKALFQSSTAEMKIDLYHTLSSGLVKLSQTLWESGSHRSGELATGKGLKMEKKATTRTGVGRWHARGFGSGFDEDDDDDDDDDDGGDDGNDDDDDEVTVHAHAPIPVSTPAITQTATMWQ